MTHGVYFLSVFLLFTTPGKSTRNNEYIVYLSFCCSIVAAAGDAALSIAVTAGTAGIVVLMLLQDLECFCLILYQRVWMGPHVFVCLCTGLPV